MNLADLVEGDQFTAKVQVAGSVDYETQIGGDTNAPLLTVMWIKVTRSLD